MKLLTWNINSIRKRLDLLDKLTGIYMPDVVLLQETKVKEEEFPHEALEDAWPHRAVHGQPGYNGVCILSRYPLTDIYKETWAEKEQARHIAATVHAPDIEPIEVHSLYVPAGGDEPDREKNPAFGYKLDWVDEAGEWYAGKYGFRDRVVVAGDLNIAPLPTDVWDHAKLRRVVSHTEEEIERLLRFKRGLNWIDVVRDTVGEDDPIYTWWSYRAKDWQASNKGRRLDHIWVTPGLQKAFKNPDVLVDVRDWQPGSDHAPVMVTFTA